MTSAPATFSLKSGSDNFKSKQRSLFDVLATVEKDVNLPKAVPEPMEVDTAELRRRAGKHRSRTRALRGQESLFKVPGLPPLRPRMPDHRRNPSRWTKYSLADVAPDDMSEASNTAAAMDFLRSLQEKPPDIIEELPSRIQFNRSIQKRNERRRVHESDESDVPDVSVPEPQLLIGFGDRCLPIEESPPVEKAVFKQNRLVMPEYVVGEKVVKPKKVRQPKVVGKELALTHLLHQDDE